MSRCRFRALTFAAIFMVGCTASPSSDGRTSSTQAARDSSASKLTDALRTAGLDVRSVGSVQQPFFSVPAQVYQVDGGDLQVYEFRTAAEAVNAASQVSPDGGSISTSMVTWMASPHFFRKDRLVVNYIGDSEKTLAELQRSLGPQFAGR